MPIDEKSEGDEWPSRAWERLVRESKSAVWLIIEPMARCGKKNEQALWGMVEARSPTRVTVPFAQSGFHANTPRLRGATLVCLVSHQHTRVSAVISAHVDERLAEFAENKKAPKVARSLNFSGASGGTRTHDLRFTKPLLYQLSYVSNVKSLYTLLSSLTTGRNLGLTVIAQEGDKYPGFWLAWFVYSKSFFMVSTEAVPVTGSRAIT